MEDHLALGSAPSEKLYQYVDLTAHQERGSICESSQTAQPHLVVFLSNCGDLEKMMMSVKW